MFFERFKGPEAHSLQPYKPCPILRASLKRSGRVYPRPWRAGRAGDGSEFCGQQKGKKRGEERGGVWLQKGNEFIF